MKDQSINFNHFPTNQKELQSAHIDQLDIILITGDAYVDHPSFGVAIIARVLESIGFKIGIIAQPNWTDDLRDFKKLGVPKLFFGITSGNMDSMANHYTGMKKKRSEDAYTPGGRSGARPDYACSVYSKIVKKLFPDSLVVLGGIEASMRRVAHYDYWSDRLCPSILFDSQADLLVYGMAEKSIAELAVLLRSGASIFDPAILNILQLAFVWDCNQKLPLIKNYQMYELCSLNDYITTPQLFLDDFLLMEQMLSTSNCPRFIQKHNDRLLVINPPRPPLTEEEMDQIYALPFTRMPHPRYKKKPAIPAFEMIKTSITCHRGCFGGCSFCAITLHQGKSISSRSVESIINEVKQIQKQSAFKGVISDVGGPSANMYKMTGKDDVRCNTCRRVSCLYPEICNNLDVSQDRYIDLLKSVSNISGIKKVFVGSGLRYDLLLEDKKAFCEIVKNHVGGRLKIAPEHSSDDVLRLMRKPKFDKYIDFHQQFFDLCVQLQLNFQLIPYMIASHPGTTIKDMADLAVSTAKLGYCLDQVQDFTPTPMTLSSVLYYTQLDPVTKKNLYVAKSPQEKEEERLFFFWYKSENWEQLKKILRSNKLNTHDLFKYI